MELNKRKYHQFIISALNKEFNSKSFFENDANENFQILSDELSIGVKIFYNTYNLEIPVIIEMILRNIKDSELDKNFNEKIFIIDSDLSAILDNLFEIIDKTSTNEIQIWDLNTLKKHYNNFPFKNSNKKSKKQQLPLFLTNFPKKTDFENSIFENKFKNLDSEFFSNNNQVCILYNDFWGNGKTTFSTEYVHSRKNKFEHIAYIKITNDFRIDFIYSFINSPFDYYYDFQDNVFLNFYKLIAKLSLFNEKTILIIDGITLKTKIAIIKEIVKDLDCKILIISDEKFSDFFSLEIKISERQFALENFKNYMPKVNESKFDEIFQKVEYNLFLINFIGKQIKNNKLNFNDIFETIKSKDAKIYHLNKYFQSNISVKGNVVNKFLVKRVMSVYELQAKEFSYTQKKILATLSILPDIKIKISDLQNLLNISDSKIDDFVDNILDLHNRGWLNLNKNFILLNRIIKIVFHKKLKPKASYLNDIVEFVIKESRTDELSNNSLTIWMFSNSILNNITSESKKLSILAEATAEMAEELGYWDLSVEYYDFACLIYEKTLKPGELNYSSLSRLIQLAYNSKDYEKALYYTQIILETLENEFDDKDENVANIYIQTALIYDQLNDYNNSIFYITEAIDILETIYEPKDLPLENAHRIHNELSSKYRSHEFEINIKDFIDRFYDETEE